jgi:hypothetical protein
MSNDFHNDNHYVPRMYLKPWETTAHRVWTYRFLVAHESAPVWKPFSSKSLGHHLHLYTRQSAGNESDEIERWFDREFERPAHEPIQKALSDKRLTINDWKCLIRFLAAQDVRTPAWFHSQNAAMGSDVCLACSKRLWKQSLRNMTKAEKPGTRSHLHLLRKIGSRASNARSGEAQSVRDGEIGVEMLTGRKLWLWSIQRALTETLPVLYQHRWTILRPPQRMTWLTSDNPVIG